MKPRGLAALKNLIRWRRSETDSRVTKEQLDQALNVLQATQERLIQQERLSALGLMASDMVRDLNNVLTPILGFSELLLNNDILLHNPAQSRRFLEMLHASARDAARLVARWSQFYPQAELDAESPAVQWEDASGNAGIAATGLSVLVVDDDERVCEVIAEYLIGDGHEVTIATSGREAISQVEREKFDVVFLDRAMPEMSGDQTAERIKKTLPQLPIILLTGFGALIEVTGSRPRAVDAVLGKPVTQAILRQTLAKFSHAA